MSLFDLYEKHLQEINKPKTLLELVEEKIKAEQAAVAAAIAAQVAARSVESETKSKDNQKKPPEVFGSLEDEVGVYRQKIALRENVFEQYVSQHRPHQKIAIEKALEENIGQVIIPTGTGKTRVQIHLHVSDMIAKTKQEQTGVYVIGAHRLLLCKQLMDELQDLCIKVGLPINVLYIGSARHDEKHVYKQYFSMGIDKYTYESTYTTVGKEVKEFYDKTKRQGRHLIVVSTYHSFDRLQNISRKNKEDKSIDLCTYDEAHTTIAEDFSESIFEKVFDRVRRNYFFTATRKVNGEDGGMNDKTKYGGTLCSISPRDMIIAGEIVPPRIHTIKLDNDSGDEVSESNEMMLMKTVIEAYTEHEKRLKADSAYPDMIGAKLLVSAKGSTEIGLIQNNTLFQEWCDSNNIKVYSYSSCYGNFEDFVKEENRNKVYESMRNLKDTDKCILLHIDILTEGIDLPSVTGVLLLRHLNEASLFQALGRALRLLKSDRKKLYDGEIKPQDKNLFTKPYAYLILPMHFEEFEESAEEMKKTLRRIILEYGIPTEEFLPYGDPGDTKDRPSLPPVTDFNPSSKKNRLYPLMHVIEDILVEGLSGNVPSDPQKKYDYLMGAIKQLNEKMEECINA